MYTVDKRYGFTLAELLIALAVLGVIATFSIPKILGAKQDQQKLAIFKEDIAAIHQAVYSAIQQGTLQANDHSVGCCAPVAYADVLASSINSIRRVGNKVYLANGSSISFATGWVVDFAIDYDGDNGSNLIGEDILWVYYNDASGDWEGISPNRISPSITGNNPGGNAMDASNNRALYNQIYP